jgi:hypothetical protein
MICDPLWEFVPFGGILFLRCSNAVAETEQVARCGHRGTKSSNWKVRRRSRTAGEASFWCT